MPSPAASGQGLGNCFEDSPRLIDSLFLAAIVYYFSRNVASFRLKDFLEVLKLVSQKSLSVGEAVSILGSRVHKRDVSGYLSLGWHLGLLGYYSKSGVGVYTLSPYGKKVLEVCSNVDDECRAVLKKVFSSWLPLRILLQFFKSVGSDDYRRAVDVLGKDMEFWTRKMIEIGLPVHGSRPVKKPYNDYIVRKLFKPLIQELGIGLGDATEGKHIVVWGRDKEPVIAAGVADIAYSARKEVFIAVYVADERGLELVLKAIEVSRFRPEAVTIVTYRIGFNEGRAVEARQRLRGMGTELEVYKSLQPLHAKIYTNEEKAMLTSVNLNKTSLFRNIEFALLVPEPSITETAKARILATAARII